VAQQALNPRDAPTSAPPDELSSGLTTGLVLRLPDVTGVVEPALEHPSRLEASVAGRAIKRTIDIGVALLVLLPLLPFIAAIALAIVIDSRGSPLFVHRRVGRRGRPFGVLKFRTMSDRLRPSWTPDSDADPALALEWKRARKLRDDPRVTRLGRFLRKYSIDEVPQLFNVLIGHMSLVGPRPVVDDELELFGDAAGRVLTARPGVTGLWTVNGRNHVTYPERVLLEARYIDEWSLRLDLEILLKTIPCVLSGRGAY